MRQVLLSDPIAEEETVDIDTTQHMGKLMRIQNIDNQKEEKDFINAAH